MKDIVGILKDNPIILSVNDDESLELAIEVKQKL